MKPDGDDGFRLWSCRRASLPPRPDDPSSLPETDSGHWYDLEFAGWYGEKEIMPQSPGDGPAGKRVLCLRPGPHPYMTLYDAGMSAEAALYGIELEIRRVDWGEEGESKAAESVIASRPDLVILVPEDMHESCGLLARLHGAGIPVVASNLKPEPEAFRYVLAWTGPDDWGQFRSLASEFVARTGGRGGYCLLTHKPGNSAYYARLWATVTEIARLAPGMRLLDARFTGFRADVTEKVVSRWLETWGGELAGIVSADDSTPMVGVRRALAAAGRNDLVLVACGSTGPGLRLVKEGALHAITWQSPELDGALPVRVAADWFNGLAPEPVRHLPHYIITRETVDDFLLMPREPSAVDPEELCLALSSIDASRVEAFFADLRDRLRAMHIVPEEYFLGSCMELLSRMGQVSRLESLPALRLEEQYRQLMLQKSPGQTLSWLESIAMDILGGISLRRGERAAPGERLVRRVETDFASPISLKTLSLEFGISPARLGSLFKDTTGESFPKYLNEVRIRAACRLLAQGGLTAKEVAVRVGYGDPDYFYSVFRKIEGCYPSEYSRRLKRGS